MRFFLLFLMGLGLAVQAWAEGKRPKPRSAALGVAVAEGTPGLTRSAPGAVKPPARAVSLPRTRWETVPGSERWTRAALAALKDHGRPLLTMVPKDIETWCPAYPMGNSDQRAAFWVGFISALARYESTFRERAVGGGGKWYGLMQILPSTARGYGCQARNGAALKDGAANLSCAIRIMAVTVPRDGEVGASGKGGVAADWGPMVFRKKRADIASYTRRQTYCRLLGTVRPKARPYDRIMARTLGEN